MFQLGPALVDFSRHHQNRWNRALHAVGLPAIAGAVLGLLARVPIPGTPLDAGLVLLGLTLVLDLALNVRIALGVAVAGTLLWAVTRHLPLEALGGLFAVGWIFQLVGHRLCEKNAPAFTDNARHLFVGPRWLINRLVRALPEVDPPLTEGPTS